MSYDYEVTGIATGCQNDSDLPSPDQLPREKQNPEDSPPKERRFPVGE